MTKITRSSGTTKSERYLAKLADRTFLNLWAYPNVYRDEIVNGHRTGKELCDLLVVCGKHIIIFSDKENGWSEDKDTNVAWVRWYKRAVQKSVKQIRGAERWINEHPDRIFIDPACTQRLPIELPTIEKRKIKAIAIARGAYKASSEFFNGDSGSFMIQPNIKGGKHFDSSSPDFFPFRVGDVDPDGSFIHVMDDLAFDVVMRELDTITDFTDYLEKKEKFIRSGYLGLASGEEDLLAYYLEHLTGTENIHGFPHPDGRPWEARDHLAIDGGYTEMLKSSQYKRKKEADENSYIWDRLIEAFTNHLLAGTTIVPDGKPLDVSKYEIGVSIMANEPRLHRRMLGKGIIEVLEEKTPSVERKINRRFRSMLPLPERPEDKIGYVFMTLEHPSREMKGGYEKYRKVRSDMLLVYCLGLLKKYPNIKTIVGVATEPMENPRALNGSSEDMVFAEQPPEWTPELEADLAADLKDLDILKEENINLEHRHVEEYPAVSEHKKEEFSNMNRHQRRAMMAKERRQK